MNVLCQAIQVDAFCYDSFGFNLDSEFKFSSTFVLIILLAVILLF